MTKNLKFIFWDGVFYSLMVGAGENYLIPFALFLNATSAQVGYLVSVPQLLGAFFQLFSVFLLSDLGKRKTLMMAGVGIQALSWGMILWAPAGIPRHALGLLLASYSLYFISGNLASPPWNSLVGDIVPDDRRGNFFGSRTRFMSLGTFLSLCISGIVLYQASKSSRLYEGFILIFTLAAIFRLISFSFLGKMSDPREEAHETLSLPDFFREIRKSNFIHFALFSALTFFAVMVAGPFFSVYMLRDLHFSYLEFMSVNAMVVVAQFLTYLMWGNFADRYGNRAVLKITGMTMPVLPILWTISPNFYYILCIQMVSGTVWAGFTLSIANYIFDAVPPSQRARGVAFYSILNGLGIFFGALLGGELTSRIPSLLAGFGITVHWTSNILGLFIVSGLLRMIIAAIFLPKLRETREVEPFSLRQAFSKNLRFFASGK